MIAKLQRGGKEWASLNMVGNIGSTENIVWDFRL
jgi:hypothetical protein